KALQFERQQRQDHPVSHGHPESRRHQQEKRLRPRQARGRIAGCDGGIVHAGWPPAGNSFRGDWIPVSFVRLSMSALIATRAELPDIASAAISGLSVIGYRTPAASGNAITL